jgi:hypothetical protein
VFMLLCHRLEDMVWVDETATYMEMAPTHGRSPRGVRVRFKTRKKHRRHTLICACNLDGVVASMLITGGMKTHHWREFCAKHLAPKLSSRHLVQWDNLYQMTLIQTNRRLFRPPVKQSAATYNIGVFKEPLAASDESRLDLFDLARG